MNALNIKEILTGPISTYKGSESTRSMIEKQIKERWGEKELKNYDPLHTARTFHSWIALGFRVKKGEKALKSITFIEVKDNKGNLLNKVKRPCSLFFYKQVEKIK
ncbi:hypothetical protein KKC45_02525 [Patescibacteria group bacterium]|nr:hypothetical protein [Patescibacteria group bacterium]